MSQRQLREVRTEEPVKEIWSMLSFFESKHNCVQYLENKFQNTNCDLTNTANSLAFTMSTAREYYEASEKVTILTRPLLIFYGMNALAKVLFMANHGKKSPSNSHGLTKAEKWSGKFEELTVEIRRDGTFPQFHGCFSNDNLASIKFSTKELLSVIPEIKVEFETVIGEKSRALKTKHSEHGINIIDTDLEKYTVLEKELSLIPGFQESFVSIQRLKDNIFLWSNSAESNKHFTRTIFGENYITLTVEKNGRFLILPEMSAHYLIMFLLGMLSRYQPQEWGRTIKGEVSGEIYLVQKFLEVTKRKFPNLILNNLHNRDFVFLGPALKTETKFTKKQLDDIAEHTSRYIGEQIRRRM